MRAPRPLAVAGSLLIALVATVAACDRIRPPWQKRHALGPAPVLPHPALTTTGSQASIADVVAKALPSVVSIASTRAAPSDRRALPFLDDPFLRDFFGPFGPGEQGDRDQRGLGSGVVVSKDGLVLTNAHVVARADRIVVTAPDGAQHDAKLVGADPKSDLALIKLEGTTRELSPIAIGDSSRLRLGDVVVAIGNPFGVGQTVTLGIVSAKGRANLGIVDYEDFIQTDAAINPGNSGGALVDMNGDLVGISTAILSRHGGYMGIGFAIPSNMAKPIMLSLREHGRVARGWLGVAIQDVDRELAQALDLAAADGVLVTDVEAASPAARAGLARGDVILRVDDVRIVDAGSFRNLIAAAGAKRSIKLEIVREARPQRLSVELGEAPDDIELASADLPLPPRTPVSLLEGLTLEALEPETRARHRIPHAIRGGVVVTSVVSNSAAARAGLLPGDVLLEVDQQRVEDVAGFVRQWGRAKGKTLLLVARGGRSLFLVADR